MKKLNLLPLIFVTLIFSLESSALEVTQQPGYSRNFGHPLAEEVSRLLEKEKTYQLNLEKKKKLDKVISALFFIFLAISITLYTCAAVKKYVASMLL
ncbi:MAG TPA: hypothetical protein VK325_02610 [Pseudoxanthomonas sp.]|nr:hypothetical protein [Pseudoxanthomonas sp.]